MASKGESVFFKAVVPGGWTNPPTDGPNPTSIWVAKIGLSELQFSGKNNKDKNQGDLGGE